ncbi:hypothetical protein NDU88_002957 [Pleurodeles waltl]|uniref:Uncharacterized protein n=1 Tax=Pleurodeles waltl TaxID=8319 RepID=A0AAV7KVN5_PLEWA|nr:hypothetical protein NDU88_002957 [Pleurodeles waltl]
MNSGLTYLFQGLRSPSNCVEPSICSNSGDLACGIGASGDRTFARRNPGHRQRRPERRASTPSLQVTSSSGDPREERPPLRFRNHEVSYQPHIAWCNKDSNMAIKTTLIDHQTALYQTGAGLCNTWEMKGRSQRYEKEAEELKGSLRPEERANQLDVDHRAEGETGTPDDKTPERQCFEEKAEHRGEAHRLDGETVRPNTKILGNQRVEEEVSPVETRVGNREMPRGPENCGSPHELWPRVLWVSAAFASLPGVVG